MKEYLIKDPQTGYYWASKNKEHGFVCEIPFGATIAIHLNKNNQIYFRKNVDRHFMEGRWVSCEKSGILNQDDFLSNHEGDCIIVWQRHHIKPKEYLFKGIDGSYKLVDHDCQGRAIEIPDGAEAFMIGFSDTMKGAFYKNDFTLVADITDKNEWFECAYNLKELKRNGGVLVWQRHNQPEELPFVDDGPMTEDYFKKQLSDNVNHPPHYTSGPIECIDAIESSMSKEAFAGFLKGNVQKYMWRYENKGGVESLQKAQWYLNRLILLQSAHD